MFQEDRQQLLLHALEPTRGTESRQVGNLEIGVAARIDALERVEIDVNVQRHAVKTRSATDAQPDTRQLHSLDINTRGIAATRGFNTVFRSKIDDALLEGRDQWANSDARAPEIN